MLEEPFTLNEPEALVEPDIIEAPETNSATAGVAVIAVFIARKAGLAFVLFINEDEIPTTVKEPVMLERPFTFNEPEALNEPEAIVLPEMNKATAGVADIAVFIARSAGSAVEEFVKLDEIPVTVNEPVILEKPFTLSEPEVLIEPDIDDAPETNSAIAGVAVIAVFIARRAGLAFVLFINEDEIPVTVNEPVILERPFTFNEPEVRIEPDTTAAPETNKATAVADDIAVFIARRAGSIVVLFTNEDEIPVTVNEPDAFSEPVTV
jgi:pilus assembly protein FimV